MSATGRGICLLENLLDIARLALRVTLLVGAIMTLIVLYLAVSVRLFRAILNG